MCTIKRLFMAAAVAMMVTPLFSLALFAAESLRSSPP